jgi:hypothetical protein
MSPPFSGRASLATVMEAARLRDSHDSSEFWQLQRPRLGRILGQRKMGVFLILEVSIMIAGSFKE